MEYSKIKKIKAVNFRSIGNIEIDMSDSPIIALTGSNESGKSSTIHAFGAAAGNLRRTKHNQYIRTGTDGFAVLIELMDGTQVLRKKSSSLNGYTLKLPDGQKRDATKIDVEVPDYIEAVMGMYRDPETKECLQVRTCDDPLLFVNTTDGQNYKAMHNAINNLDVRESTIKAKVDAANLLAEATKKRTEVAIYKKQLAELPLLDTDYLQVVLSALERAKEVSKKFDVALDNVALLEQLDGLDAKKLKNCKTVDMDALRLYTEAMRHYTVVQEVTDAKKLENCDMIDTNTMRLYTEALKHMDVVREADALCYDNVDTVNVAPISLFERGLKYIADVKESSINDVPNTVNMVSTSVLPLFEKAKEHMGVIAEISERLDKLNEGIRTVTAAIKASGIRVISCDNCGHDMAVPTEA